MSVRHLWTTAGILLGALIALGFLTEFGRPTHVLFDGPISLPSTPESAATDAAATAVGPFELAGPTTLRLEQTQAATTGAVRTHVALIHQETGEVRETDLATTAAKPSWQADSALVDGLPSGTYVLRFDASWRQPSSSGPGRPSNAGGPTIRIRAVDGASTPWAFALAALAILVPPTFVTVRRWRRAPRNAPNRSAGALAT